MFWLYLLEKVVGHEYVLTTKSLKCDKLRDLSKTLHWKRLHSTIQRPEKKLQKQSILTFDKFFLGSYMTYLFYCTNRLRLEWPLRKGMGMGVSMCKMLHLFSLKDVAFTLNYIGKLFSILWPKRKPGPVTKELYLHKITIFWWGITRFGNFNGINAFVLWI